MLTWSMANKGRLPQDLLAARISSTKSILGNRIEKRESQESLSRAISGLMGTFPEGIFQLFVLKSIPEARIQLPFMVRDVVF